MSGAHKRWTDAEESRLADLDRKGMSLGEIARAMGRSLSGVNNRLVRLRKERRLKIARKERRLKIARKAPAEGRAKSWAAVIPCLGCREDFNSWDRRRNRLCARCK